MPPFSKTQSSALKPLMSPRLPLLLAAIVNVGRSDAVITPAESLQGKGAIDFSASPTIKPPAEQVLIDSAYITTGQMCREPIKADES